MSESKQFLRRVRQAGWQIKRTTRGHYQLLAPNGRGIVTYAVSDDWRAIKNTERDMKRVEHG